MAKYSVGSVVQLNSGGPAMTVKESHSNSSTCSFFDGQGEADEMSVPDACLKEYKEPKPRARKK